MKYIERDEIDIPKNTCPLCESIIEKSTNSIIEHLEICEIKKDKFNDRILEDILYDNKHSLSQFISDNKIIDELIMKFGKTNELNKFTKASEVREYIFKYIDDECLTIHDIEIIMFNIMFWFYGFDYDIIHTSFKKSTFNSCPPSSYE